MIINIKVHPKSSQKKIVIKDDIYHAYLHAAPEKGKANIELIELLSQHFNIAKTKINILSGDNSPHKKIKIN